MKFRTSKKMKFRVKELSNQDDNVQAEKGMIIFTRRLPTITMTMTHPSKRLDGRLLTSPSLVIHFQKLSALGLAKN